MLKAQKHIILILTVTGAVFHIVPGGHQAQDIPAADVFWKPALSRVERSLMRSLNWKLRVRSSGETPVPAIIVR